ncbi:MAG: hypothetical protein ABI718_18545 [Acidobacteriota bacterium]
MLAASLLLLACGETPTATPTAERPSREPISVRGWIADIDNGKSSPVFRTVETEAARRAQAFQETNVWVENAAYVSGGVAETGAFILLDVPPGKASIQFSATGVPNATVLLENVPGNADVIIPGLILKPGGVSIEDPKAIQVRLAANVSKPVKTNLTAKVAGHDVTVMQVPINTMIDRRDFPNPPTVSAPVATVK